MFFKLDFTQGAAALEQYLMDTVAKPYSIPKDEKAELYAQFTPEQLHILEVTADEKKTRYFATGALHMLWAYRKAQGTSQLLSRISDLERTVRRLQGELETAGVPAKIIPRFTLDEAPPTLQRKRPRPKDKDEVLTECPTAVRDTARQVEEFVARMGPCTKSDVSAHLPCTKSLLTEAYRHLHASRRIHVSGNRLEPWDEQRHGARGRVQVKSGESAQ